MKTKWKKDRINIEEYHAKICIDMILEFKAQIKFPSYTENYYCDKRKLSDYDCQQLWDFIQKKIITF